MKRLNNEWLLIDKIVLYGWGNIGKKCFRKFEQDFDIVLIIDENPHKQGEVHGIPIKGMSDSLDIMKSNKIIVLTGGKAYKDIADSLILQGLQEYTDFCAVEVFISEWYWEKKHENCLLEVHTAVTMQCTFKCKNCNMFVPYYHEKIDYSFEELKEMYDLFFKYVDYAFCISLLGGEPFLNSSIGEIINYLGERYFDKIGVINIISNGSIEPDEKTMKIMRRNNVLVYLSNYSSVISYESKFRQVEEKFKENNINCVVRGIDCWKDFGFPNTVPNIFNSNVKDHMDLCAPVFHGLNDNKFYYCHVAWSAEKAGLYKLKRTDYICLDSLGQEDKRKIVKHALGEIEGQYVSLCELCGGCGEDNLNIISAAIQME